MADRGMFYRTFQTKAGRLPFLEVSEWLLVGQVCKGRFSSSDLHFSELRIVYGVKAGALVRTDARGTIRSLPQQHPAQKVSRVLLLPMWEAARKGDTASSPELYLER